MKVVLFFMCEEGRRPETIRYMMYGRFSEVGFMFVEKGKEMAVFGTTVHNRYRRFSLNMKAGAHFEFLLLPVNDEESTKLYATCDACSKAVKPFNLADLLQILVPFREPDEIPLFDTITLNNTQAVILILRECLEPGNVLRCGIDGLHSRLTFTETLFDRLRPYTLPVLYANLQCFAVGELGETEKDRH
jgi:hypothetical protein